MTMRHAQRALLILVERLFSEEDDVTDEDREACLRLGQGEVREVFRLFLRATFSDHEIDIADRKRLLVIAQRLHLPEELVPAVTYDRAA